MILGKCRNGGCTLTDSVRMKLARERDRRGMTFREAGAALGICEDHYRRLERGMATPKYELLVAWAKLLGFEVDVRLLERKP